ncbi:hypothetical protein [Paraclostridium bifermentans]|uniref:hypothetical protein n=1 Tax=Paraclostridium bifermentans TaxID=1490 RepID=UPI00359C8842
MKDNKLNIAYFNHLYKKGIINRNAYKKILRDLMRERNKLVTIKSSYNDKYVSVEGELNELMAIENKIELSDRFVLIDMGNGDVIIQTQEGYYIKVDNKSNELFANETKENNATIFTLMPINEKEVALKSDNGYYIKVRDNGMIFADACMQNERTVFKIKEVTKIEYDDIVIISLSEQRFVTAMDGGGSYLTATEFDQSDNEEFTILQFLDESIIIKTFNGYYVRTNEDKTLIADTKNIEDATLFKGETIENYTRIIKTLDGSIVRVRDIDKYLVADAEEINENCKFNIYKSTRPF